MEPQGAYERWKRLRSWSAGRNDEVNSVLGFAFFLKAKLFFVPVEVSSAGWKSAGRHPASIAGKPEGHYKRTSPLLCVFCELQ